MCKTSVLLSILFIVLGVIGGIININVVQAGYVELYHFTEDFSNQTIHDIPYNFVIYVYHVS